jgi:PAS domain S-box-containing protein
MGGRAVKMERQVLEGLGGLAQALGTARDLPTVFRSLVEFIADAVPCNGLFVSLYDPERQERTCVYAFTEGQELDASTLPPLPMTDSPHSRAVATGEIVVTDHLQAELVNQPHVDVGLDIDPRLPQSSIAVPMATSGRVIGGFEVQAAQPRAYEPEHVSAMQMAANLAAIAVENVRLLDRERELRLASEASEQRHRSLVAAISQVVWTADAEGRSTGDVPGWRALTGQTVQEMQGWGWMDAIHPDDRERTVRAWYRAVRTKSLYESEYRVRMRNGSYRHFASRGAPVLDTDGSIVEWFGVCLDIDEEKQVEEQQRFLAEASRILGSSLDYESTLASVARLTVPLMADACLVYVVEEDGEVRRLEAAHANPEKEEMLRQMQRSYPIQSHEQHPVLNVLRSGQPELIPEITDSLLRSVARDEGQLALFRALSPKSLMVVPLIARERILGAINFAVEDGVRRYGPAQLLRAEELAGRAALAIDNARLYKAEQEARRRAEHAADRTSRMQAITAALSEALTPLEVAEAVVEHGRAALEAAAGFVARLTQDGEALELLCALGYPEQFMNGNRHCPVSAQLPAAEVIRTREPVWLASEEERNARYPHLADVASDLRYCAWAAIPIVVEGRCIGAWGLSFPEPREANEEELGFMLALGRQCGQALERARLYEESHEANRAKSDFLAVMSHELRTPLSAIIGYTDLLADEIVGPVTEAQRTQLGRVKASSWHLLNLIEEILTFARMEAGRNEVRFELVDMRSVAQEAADMVEPNISEKGVSLQVVLPAESVKMQTDPGKLRQILINLLSNAMKFTEEGEIRFHVHVEHDVVVFTVADTGIGISPEHFERIFEPFRQVEHAMTRKVGGTGLGLSVTRGLAHLLGGTVQVESIVGEGSTFVVRLPLRLSGP